MPDVGAVRGVMHERYLVSAILDHLACAFARTGTRTGKPDAGASASAVAIAGHAGRDCRRGPHEPERDTAPGRVPRAGRRQTTGPVLHPGQHTPHHHPTHAPSHDLRTRMDGDRPPASYGDQLA